MGRNSAIINSSVLLAPILFGICIFGLQALPQGLMLVVAIALSLASIALLLLGKLPKLRQGDFISLGVGGMGKRRWLYVIAYVLLFWAIAAWGSVAILVAFL